MSDEDILELKDELMGTKTTRKPNLTVRRVLPRDQTRE